MAVIAFRSPAGRVWALGGPLFEDRVEAGRELARRLGDELPRTSDAVVLGLARGGVVVAAEVAAALGLPLDALAVRKVRHPLRPEYALGAVAPREGVYLRGRNGLSDDDLARAVALAGAEAEALDRSLHGTRPPLELSGRDVIVVDDGLATGATMVAGIRHARRRGAASAVAAVPVGAAESIGLVEREADACVCVHELDFFGAVGIWYGRFGEVSEEEVGRLLEHRTPPERREVGDR